MLHRLTVGGFGLRLDAGVISPAADTTVSAEMYCQPLSPALTSG